MANRLNTTDPRRVRKLWEELGGSVLPVRKTGEVRWVPVRVADRVDQTHMIELVAADFRGRLPSALTNRTADLGTQK
jgi:hypothetical protein